MIFIEETPPVDQGDGHSVEGGEAAAKPADVTQFATNEPISVELTDQVYGGFKESFGEDEAASLQRAWGDHALSNERIARAVVEDHPKLDEIYVKNQTEDGGLSVSGAQAAAQFLTERFGLKDIDALVAAHPEIEGIYYDHADENGNLSATGVHRILHYVGKRSGYKFNYRGKR